MGSYDCDVAIVGGGPAGAATALFACAALPRATERIAVIDKARFPREKVCAGAIGARADALLSTIGVQADVPSAEVAGLGVTTPAGALALRLSEAGSFPRAIGRVVRRVDFDAALLAAVRERGVAVHEGTALTAMRCERDGVHLETSAGLLRARAVVGADGVGSAVRRLAGFPRGPFHAQAVEVDTPRVPGDPSDDLLWFDLSGPPFAGYAWSFPTVVNGERLVCRGVYRLTRGAPSDEGPDVAALLRDELARRGIAAAGLRFKRFATRGLSLHEPSARPRVLLAGEAAGIDPVLGEGIPQAIFYGKAAGEYLARCIERGDYGFSGYRRALAASRVGVDLRLRAAMLPWLYGRGRAHAERWVTSSHHLALAGMCYFAGHRVPRWRIVAAGFDLLRSRRSASLSA